MAILEASAFDIPVRVSDGSPTTKHEEEPEEAEVEEEQKENCIAMKEEVVAAAEALVQNVMGSWDGSHDPFHAYRVRSLSLSLASEEGLHPDSLFVVELAALLHDIGDHKYASRGPREFPTAKEFLLKYGVETEKREAVLTSSGPWGLRKSYPVHQIRRVVQSLE